MKDNCQNFLFELALGLRSKRSVKSKQQGESKSNRVSVFGLKEPKNQGDLE